jgi:alpha-tubulin suppressor-like RCC1 family protein
LEAVPVRPVLSVVAVLVAVLLPSSSLAATSSPSPSAPEPPSPRTLGAARAITGFTQVSAGGDYSCGVGGGRVRCWGRNTWGQVGTGARSAPVTSPTQVGSWSDWKRVSAGGATTCGIRTKARQLWCWGLNNKGQFGNGTRAGSLTPVRTGGLDWKAVSLSWFHGCGIHKTDQLVCWGDNTYGQLGRGNTDPSLSMRRVAGSWSKVAAQGWSTCGIRTDHSLWCWGRNTLGGLGIGSFASRDKPTRVGPTSYRWRQVAMSWTHTCALRWDRSVWCWGRNDLGGVGDGTTTTRNRPTRVLGTIQGRSVSAFEGGACVVSTTGRTFCWGDNRYKQVGGTAAYYTRPHYRSGSYTVLSSGWFHTCGLGVAVTCWGANEQHQLGYARPTVVQPDPRLTPRQRAQLPLGFRLATFNALGDGHSGPYHDADGYAPSRLRTEWLVRTVVNQDLDVVGVQETSAQQVSQILRAAGPGRLAAFPNPAVNSYYPETTLFWNPQKFEVVKTGVVRSMFINNTLPRPYAELRDRATGREFWVMAIHNAGWNYPGRAEARKQAMITQLDKISDLQATGLPVFYVGDFNEKKPALCRVLRHGGMGSAIGGHLAPDGTCVPPMNMRIDWLFGSSSTQWSGYQYSRQPMVRLTTDHGVAMANVQVP